MRGGQLRTLLKECLRCPDNDWLQGQELLLESPILDEVWRNKARYGKYQIREED